MYIESVPCFYYPLFYIIIVTIMLCVFRELIEEISNVVNTGNFTVFYSILSSQLCYSKFLNSLVQYLAMLQSVQHYITNKRKLRVLLNVLTRKYFLSEEEKCAIKSRRTCKGISKLTARKEAFMDMLNEKPLEIYSLFMDCLGEEKSLHQLQSNIFSKIEELSKIVIRCKSPLSSTSSIQVVQSPSNININLDLSCSSSLKISPRSSVWQFSPPHNIFQCLDSSKADQKLKHPQLESVSETPHARHYRLYLIDRYKGLPNTSIQGWNDKQTSNFVDVTIEKIGGMRTIELANTCTTNSKIQYARQYSAQICNSVAEIFQFNEKQLILIEGNAGTGKTTLSYKVCKEWAVGNMLEQFTHVVLVHLRELEPHRIASQEDLFDNTGVDKCIIHTELATDRKNLVLFWLEGWDELHDDYKKHSVFTQLLTGEAFPRATVVVTTRPSAFINLKHYLFSDKYKLKGFSESQIKLFVDDYFSQLPQFSGEMWSVLFMQKLKSVRGLAQLAEVPLSLSILLKLFLDLRFKFPNTLTDIYYNILMLILQYHKEKTYSCDEYMKPIKNLYDLPKEMLEILQGLQKQAYDCFTIKNPITEEQMLQYIVLQGNQLKNFNGMGLLEIKRGNGFTGKFKCYLYRYRVFQEFLAALYLTTMETLEETMQLKEIFGDMDYEMVWLFYAGITGLTRVPIKDILPNLNRIQKPNLSIVDVNTHEKLDKNWQQCYAYFKSMVEHKDNHMEFLLTLILCCYEAKNLEACSFVADCYYFDEICHIEIPPNHAVPYFFLAISFFITHSGKKWSLRCDDTISSGVEFLSKYSQEKSLALHTENTGGLWALSFVVKLSEVEKFIELMKMQPTLQWVRLLNGSYLGNNGVEKLCNFLARDNCKIIKIEMQCCGIENVGLKAVANLLNNNSQLLYVNLRENLFSSENIKMLLLNIKQNTSLEYLILDEYFSKDPEIICIQQTINNMRKENKAKPLSLIQDFLDE